MPAYGEYLAGGSPEIYRVFVIAASVVGAIFITKDAKSWPLCSVERLLVLVAVSYGSLIGAALPAFLAGGWIGEMARKVLLNAHDATGKITLDILLGPKTILGGLLFGFFAAASVKKVFRIAYDTSDAFARGTCLMLLIGRIGCIFQRCCFGREVWLPGFSESFRLPVQAMEAALVFCLFLFVQRLHVQQKFQHRRLFIVFTLYGGLRCFMEFLREPLSDSYLGLGYYNWLALVLVAVGGWQLYKRREPHGQLTYELVNR